MNSNQIKTSIFVAGILISLFFFLLLSDISLGSARPSNFTPTTYLYLPLLAYLPTSTATPTPTVTPTPTATLIPPDDLANEQSIADLINQERSSNGLPPLNLVSELTQAARRHSRDMADNNFTSHTGSDGSNAGQRMLEAGYNWTTWGETIGWGFGGNPESMVDWWMNSPTHRAIILSTNYTDFGVGYALNGASDWGHYWTVNFGKRAAQNQALPGEFYVCSYLSTGPFGGSSLALYNLEPCHAK